MMESAGWIALVLLVLIVGFYAYGKWQGWG